MPGPLRQWNAPPPNSADPTRNEFDTWVMTALNGLQGPLFAPPTPVVTTISHPGGVQVAWNEVPYADNYALYESSVDTPPPGLPYATIPANVGGHSNSFLRSGLNDTTTRFYFVQAFNSSTGKRSAISLGTPGAALSTASPVIPLSQQPLNQQGVGGGTGGGGAINGITFNVNFPY